MSKESKSDQKNWMANMSKDDELDWYERTHKHWRSWGSWFSWGSPVGLGLFFISCAITLWILSQAFGWS